MQGSSSDRMLFERTVKMNENACEFVGTLSKNSTSKCQCCTVIVRQDDPIIENIYAV